MFRHDVACMMRIRNEGRWIRENLERTFEVAEVVVALDDGSDDDTIEQCFAALSTDPAKTLRSEPRLNGVHTAAGMRECGGTRLVILRSPFRPAYARPLQGVSEIRDKNYLWEYCKANVAFRHMLCLDGDERLSLGFIRHFDAAIGMLESSVDVLTLPFVYLWDGDDRIRVDGLYGWAADNLPQLRFPRLFTIDRVTPDELHTMRFSWQGTKGGFHCGSVPRECFRPFGTDPTGGTYQMPIVHYGYRDEEDRQRKYEFYNRIDPNNEFEGCYRHIIGEPDRHAPGPVQLIPYVDA
jgi:O-antigen biosynthesis protein